MRLYSVRTEDDDAGCPDVLIDHYSPKKLRVRAISGASPAHSQVGQRGVGRPDALQRGGREGRTDLRELGSRELHGGEVLLQECFMEPGVERRQPLGFKDVEACPGKPSPLKVPDKIIAPVRDQGSRASARMTGAAGNDAPARLPPCTFLSHRVPELIRPQIRR